MARRARPYPQTRWKRRDGVIFKVLGLPNDHTSSPAYPTQVLCYPEGAMFALQTFSGADLTTAIPLARWATLMTEIPREPGRAEG